MSGRKTERGTEAGGRTRSMMEDRSGETGSGYGVGGGRGDEERMKTGNDITCVAENVSVNIVDVY
jgi:hypothetical protein